MILWDAIKKGYLRIIEPIADGLVRSGISPNAITTFGTICSMLGGAIYATGHIKTAGWWLGLTALFDVLDGTVARRTGRSTVFGAFYDSTLDRVADGAVLGGLMIFFARNDVLHGVPKWAGTPMVGITLLCIIGTFLTSYTRARAESLGIDAKVGVMQRPERSTLLSAPQAFFGLLWHGYVLMFIVVLLAVTAWITAVQRILFVYRATLPTDRGARTSGPVTVAQATHEPSGNGNGASGTSRDAAPKSPAAQGSSLKGE